MEYKIRKMLWLRHGCSIPALYGDDGEMQCSKCAIDFKRDSEDVIYNGLNAQTLQNYALLMNDNEVEPPQDTEEG